MLGWDQATYMPKGGAAARSRQGATLSRLAHERLTDPALGKLLDDLAPHAERLPYDSDDASLVRIVRRDFDKAKKVPAEFVARWRAFGSASYDAWTRARPANDFATMRPLLEKALDFSRQYADFFAPYEHIADPFIDGLDEGMTTASVLALFKELRAALVPIVRAIAEQPPADDSCLRGSFPEAAQMELGLAVIERFGYDLDRGRLDKTHHPFCSRFSAGDVRITTRVRADNIGEALFSTLHEAGHALYEQGVGADLDGTPLGSGASAGVHESQSRLWENVVGRSRGVLGAFLPAPAPRLSRPIRARAAGGVLPRHQQGRAIADPHRRRRGDLQSAHHDAVRPGAGHAGGPARGQGPAGGLARALRGRLRPHPARRSGRLPAGCALVCRHGRRRLPGLRNRQHPVRAALRRSARRASPDPSRDGEG